jgi:Mn-dependent DtxR family transcriptional regulator
MVSIACGLFALAFLLAPKQGLIATAARRLKLRLRMSQENVIRHLLKLAAGKPHVSVEAARVAEAMQIDRWQLRAAVSALKHREWIEAAPETGSALRLTARGQAQAERLDRAHRLWETFLVEKVGLPSDHVHPTAEKVEHLLSEQLVERVDDELGHPVIDPHGSPIPRSSIADGTAGNYTLSKLRTGDRARVVGLVDAVGGITNVPAAPAGAASKVAGLGLTLGQTFDVIERSAEPPSWTVTLDDGRQFPVPHDLADLVLVQIVSANPSRSSGTFPDSPESQ